MEPVIAVFTGNIRGTVLFENMPQGVTRVQVDLTGFLPRAVHGFHLHEYGDLSNGCKSLGPHYNPDNTRHGSRYFHGNNRHVGDLINNINANDNGEVHMTFNDSLFTVDEIRGRSLVIHHGRDDLGLGGNMESLTTGNAGSRMACAIIGIFNPTE